MLLHRKIIKLIHKYTDQLYSHCLSRTQSKCTQALSHCTFLFESRAQGAPDRSLSEIMGELIPESVTTDQSHSDRLSTLSCTCMRLRPWHMCRGSSHRRRASLGMSACCTHRRCIRRHSRMSSRLEHMYRDSNTTAGQDKWRLSSPHPSNGLRSYAKRAQISLNGMNARAFSDLHTVSPGGHTP